MHLASDFERINRNSFAQGLIEFIPEFNALIDEINDVLAKHPAGAAVTEAAVMPRLSARNQAVFAYLSADIKQQLLLDRDPHGNVQVCARDTASCILHRD